MPIVVAAMHHNEESRPACSLPGADLAKHVCQLHRVTQGGQVVLRRRVRHFRAKRYQYAARDLMDHAAGTASGGARIDVEAICEAVTRSTMASFRPPRSVVFTDCPSMMTTLGHPRLRSQRDSPMQHPLQLGTHTLSSQTLK